jgi:hypothetical protein
MVTLATGLVLSKVDGIFYILRCGKIGFGLTRLRKYLTHLAPSPVGRNLASSRVKRRRRDGSRDIS